MKGLRQLIALAIDVLSWFYPLMLAAIASTLTAVITHPVFSSVQLPVLLAALPLLYLLWLFLFIGLGAIATRLIFLGYSKPASLKVDLSFHSAQELLPFVSAARIISMYRMGLFMQRLPALNYSMLPPIIFTWMNRLVLSAYAPSVHLGRGSTIISRSQDPDLTYIGNNVVIGSNCQIVCHTLNTLGDTLKYASAPIKIADDVTIGGDSRLGMGVEIGRGAVVEMGSNVLPYTRIAPAEVWGGSPARLLRTREDGPIDSPHTDNAHIPSAAIPAVMPSATTSAVDNLLAQVLHLPIEKVVPDLSSATCGDWDSLAKMAIAAALFDRFGQRLAPDEIVRLSSRQAVLTQITGQTPAVASSRPSNPLSNNPLSNNSLPKIPSDPNLLPLGDWEMVTRQLAQQDDQQFDPKRANNSLVKTVRIAATFTAQPLASSLVLWCRAFGVEVSTDFLPFNQIEQTLLSPNSSFYPDASAAKNSLHIVLARPEDLISAADPDGMLRAKQIVAAIRHYAQQRSGLIVSNLPPAASALFHDGENQVLPLRSWWQAELAEIATVRLFDFAQVIESVGLLQARDSALEIVTRAPYSQRAFQQLGITIARLLRQTYLPPKKVIALDCDNTLWGGVVGEDDMSGISLGDDYPGRSFKLFQAALLTLKAQGVLLVLVSKNEADDVWQVCDRHPDMLIKRSDLAGSRINWQPKSENLRSLAQELNLGLDAFVFIDDSPNERLEVFTNAPAVTVLPLPKDPTHYVDMLSKLWCFDAASVTTEDKQRTQYMRQEQARQQLQSEGTNLSDYLTALQLEINICPASEPALARVAQLTQKTNQFNLSLLRRSLNDIQTLPADYAIWTLTVKDRFGDYGLVGIAIVKPVMYTHADTPDKHLLIDTFLMSCRALGRSVETAFMAKLFEVAQQEGCSQLVAPYAIGPRNAQVKTFLQSIGFAVTAEIAVKPDSEMAVETLVAAAHKSPGYPSYIAVQSQTAPMEIAQ